MSIRNKNKDHLKDHGGVELVAPTLAPTSDDPLRFWTNHPTENTIVDLHVFADGELINLNNVRWLGPFSGRPELITELTPAIQARLTLASTSLTVSYKTALRAFWRMLDQVEATRTPDGQTVERLTSVKYLTQLHEAAAHRAGISAGHFSAFLRLTNDALQLMRLRRLVWTVPRLAEPKRQLIPDVLAKALKIGIKRDWERVRKTWERHDAIMRGEEPDTLTEYEEQDAAIALQYSEKNDSLRRNWLYFQRIQKTTGLAMPSTDQLFENQATIDKMRRRGVAFTTMRTIAFPNREEADIAFHSTLMGSGWNPSTLITGIDATLPQRIFQHPKDAKQSVLVIDVSEDEAEDTEVTMQGSKRRAGGRMQFCIGLKKNPDSPPNIVAAYLDRTAGLREQLRQDVHVAQAELVRLRAEDAPKADVERQFKRLQTLRQGLRNVWLYVDKQGRINWLDGLRWDGHVTLNASGKMIECSYLDRVTERLNVQRVAHQETEIPKVVPSDFRDIYARWVHVQSGGNVIAVMFALGHASLRATTGYLNNNIFNAENDETMRRFMVHLFEELEHGRVDLTILAQLVRHGPLTSEMQERLTEYRSLMRSRVKAGCADPKNPPFHIEPDHIEGKWCGTQRCLRDCQNARFLPESLDGICMRVEELMVMSDHLPLDTWMRGEFEKELESGEYLLADLYPPDEVEQARAQWHDKIRSGKHVVPGVGFVREQEAA